MANNLVVLKGRLAKDVELRKTPGGLTVGNTSIAVQKDKDSAEFFNLTLWDKVAEAVEKNVKKGMRIMVAGRLATSQYEKDGVKHTNVFINVQSVDFIDTVKKESSDRECRIR